MDVWKSSGTRNLQTLARLVILTCLVGFVSAQRQLPIKAEEADFATRLDQQLTDASFQVPVQKIDESAEVRRLYLDLCGMRPSIVQVEQYLADTNPNKYQVLVETLLSSPEFFEHWAERFDVMLMERRANTYVPLDQWSQWLRDQIAQDRPLNEWLADLIVADGYPAEQRPAGRFILDRGADPHLITRDIGRIYFGRDLQCAQCHDHPSIESYLQSDYHGLLGFVASIGMTEVIEGEKKIQIISEKSASEAAFESVFARGRFQRVLPKVPASDEAEKATTVPGEDYAPAEIAGYPQRPIHSRRQLLASLIRSGQQQQFNRNLSNRLFGMIFGRAVVEPPDLIHNENPPLHPELLSFLTQELQASNFSLRAFVRQLVLTKSYRLTGGPIEYEYDPETQNDSLSLEEPTWFPNTVETAARVAAETDQQLADIGQQLQDAELAFNEAQQAFEPVEDRRVQALAAVDTARTTYSQALDVKSKASAERDAAAKNVDVHNEKINKLKSASEAASAALAAIGEDAEITASVAMFNQKLDGLNGQLPSLQQTLSEKQQAMDAAVQKVAADHEALLAAQKAADVVDQEHASVRKRLLAAREQYEAIRTERTRLGSYKRALNDLIELDAAYKGAKQLRTVQQDLIAETAKANQTVASIKAEAAKAAIALQSLESSFKAAEAAHSKAMSNVDAINQKIDALQNAEQSLTLVSTNVSKPELLEQASREIVESRQALTQQLSALAEQQTATEAALSDAKQKLNVKQAEVETLRVSLSKAIEDVNASDQKLATIRADLQTNEQVIVKSLQQLEATLGDRLLTHRLTPLMPEQMAWSFLNVTGVYIRHVDKHLAELEKEAPATAEQTQDSAFQAGRREQAVRRARAELQGNINHFINLYGAGAGQPQTDFFATADQALYASNGGTLYSWAAPSTGNVTEKIIQSTENAKGAQALYLGVLGRLPYANEEEAVDKYLGTSPAEKAKLAQELVWSLMASAEFRFKQ